MRTGAPEGGHDARPPHPHAVLPPGAPVRPSARTRPLVPVTLEDLPGEVDVTDRYVRRFWVAAIGTGAVAELLRMVRAAEKGEAVRLPRSLPILLRLGLARATSSGLRVSRRIPLVPTEMRWRFPPSLAGEHSRWDPSAPDGEIGHQAESRDLTDGEGPGDADVDLAAKKK